MNINSSNMKWFSQYFQMNRLFSRKDGSQRPGSKLTGHQISGPASGGVKYKHSNQYYNEDGVPFHSKEEADRCIKGTNGSWKKIVPVSDEAKAELAAAVKQDFIATNGWGHPDGSKKPDVINKYLDTIPSKQRNSAAWTLQRMAGDYAVRMEKLVRETNPGWKPGDAFDTQILDQLDGTMGGMDSRA